jgi:GntR family transcriptional regulator, galactonate operon transcriptional repressor
MMRLCPSSKTACLLRHAEIFWQKQLAFCRKTRACRRQADNCRISSVGIVISIQGAVKRSEKTRSSHRLQHLSVAMVLAALQQERVCRVIIQSFARPSALNADRLFGQVAELLGVAIISGAYKAGELLPNETALKGEISVSRTAYREAVKILTAKGLVEARPRSGTRVAPRSGWNLIDPDVLSWHLTADPNEVFIRDLFELRRFIEPSAARLAAQRRTEADMARIDAALRGMETAKPYSEANIRADVSFHEAIFAATHNRTLDCLANVVISTIQWSMLLQQTKDETAFDVALSDHKRVRNAIQAGDADQAGAVMTTLVLDSLHDTLAELGKSQIKHAKISD